MTIERQPCVFPYTHEKSGDHFCRCHERMGNDFYFLPIDRCLWELKADGAVENTQPAIVRKTAP